LRAIRPSNTAIFRKYHTIVTPNYWLTLLELSTDTIQKEEHRKQRNEKINNKTKKKHSELKFECCFANCKHKRQTYGENEK
jgi:hypothetical protein